MSIRQTKKSKGHPFVGKRIYLRKLTTKDASSRYCGWLNDPEVNRFLGTKHCTIPELRSYIVARNKQSKSLFFGIFLKEGDKHVGTVKLQEIGTRNDIAILIGDRACWGQGLAGEAMQLLIDYCFFSLKLREVTLGVIAQNVSAMKAYAKLGFKEVRREYGKVTYENKIFDQVTMVLKKNLDG